MLTATDVEQKTFSTALRGYDLDEVDDFLDEIVATLREMGDQLEEAREAAGAPKAPTPEPVPAPEPVAAPEPEPVPVPPPAIDESAIGRALVAAQTAADQLLVDAQTEADKIIDDARGEADTWRVERDAKKAEAESEIAALAGRVSSIRAELAVLAGEVAEKLDEMDAVIEQGEETTEPAADADLETAADAEPETATEEVEDAISMTGSVEEESDQLDEMLNGVAADLQLDSGQVEESEAEGESGEEAEEAEEEPGSEI